MITVISPVRNGDRFIESCIKNVIDQGCPDVEHLIVDGGSVDGTVSIIRRYAEQFPHIKWISEQDRGQSDAMNKGVALAASEIIGFLNVDDYYEPGTLNRVVGYFGRLTEPGLLVGNCNVWDDDDRLLFVNRPKRLRLHQLLVGFDAFPWPVNPAAYFYHRSLHEQIGPYRVDEHQALDLDFLLRAVQVANVVYVDETLGNYRLLRGTKTYLDIENGRNYERSLRLQRHYEKDLPSHVRILFPHYRFWCLKFKPGIAHLTSIVKKKLFALLGYCAKGKGGC